MPDNYNDSVFDELVSIFVDLYAIQLSGLIYRVPYVGPILGTVSRGYAMASLRDNLDGLFTELTTTSRDRPGMAFLYASSYWASQGIDCYP